MGFNLGQFSFDNVKDSPTHKGQLSTLNSKLGNPSINMNLKNINTNTLGNILHFEKVIPHIEKYSGTTSLYLYLYLDPNKPILPSEPQDKYKYKINPKYRNLFKTDVLICGFEPIYLGKGVSATGHRFNQHISSFKKETSQDEVDGKIITNKLKLAKFMEIEKSFSSQNSLIKNWDEYRNNFVKIIFQFNTREDLELAEIVLINTIGSINGTYKGPLTNILNTKDKILK